MIGAGLIPKSVRISNLAHTNLGDLSQPSETGFEKKSKTASTLMSFLEQ